MCFNTVVAVTVLHFCFFNAHETHRMFAVDLPHFCVSNVLVAGVSFYDQACNEARRVVAVWEWFGMVKFEFAFFQMCRHHLCVLLAFWCRQR